MRIEIESISAITLVTKDMSRAVNFYKNLGFNLARGSENSDFTTFNIGSQSLNLSAENMNEINGWGRVIFYVKDVDAIYKHCLNLGMDVEFAPRDALWGERYFHITDLDGHELSFAMRRADVSQ